uniref:Uncharacterized protein n=1 Tax=Strigamia maritima TaxID=126957 RepID=T1JMH7_STRMM
MPKTKFKHLDLQCGQTRLYRHAVVSERIRSQAKTSILTDIRAHVQFRDQKRFNKLPPGTRKYAKHFQNNFTTLQACSANYKRLGSTCITDSWRFLRDRLSSSSLFVH